MQSSTTVEIGFLQVEAAIGNFRICDCDFYLRFSELFLVLKASSFQAGAAQLEW